MRMELVLCALAVAVITVCNCSPVGAEKIQINAEKKGAPISPYVYGQFIEHLGRCIYGGIWAEMLEDRKFFYPVDGKQSGWSMQQGKKVSWEGDGFPYEILTASPWQILGPASAVSMSTDAPFVGEHDPVITLDGTAEMRGIYHPRLALEEGKTYVGHIIVKYTGRVERTEIALRWGHEPNAEAVVLVNAPSEEFTRIGFSLTAGGTAQDGRLIVRFQGQGSAQIGSVSLMPEDNEEGFRRDTLVLLRELNAPVYRWPGGNFVSGYDWRDGIGDRDRRPPRKNPAWTGIEHNDVGIHEYMRFCELVNAEPFIALNTGLGDVDSAAAEVAYITGPADSPEGAKRAANGRVEPWNARWWAVGNEMYGDWQLGHMPLEDYVKKHQAVVDAIRAVSPQAQCVGVGSAGKWSETMLTHCGKHMELISEHLYWQRKEEVTEHVETAVKQIEHLARTHRKYRKDIPGLAEKDIRIALDEWNYWYGPYLYGELGTRYFHRDALGCAAALHAMFRNSDLFFMANYAQTVNVIGAIKTTRTDAWLETTGQALKLYREHFGVIPVETREPIDGLDIAAAWTQDHSILALAAVNSTGAVISASLEIQGLALPETVSGWTIQHSDPEAYNDENNHDAVAIKEATMPLPSGILSVPPYSITLLHIPADHAGAVRWNLEEGRWSVERANAWYAEQGWLAGANFVPSTASNQLEMWQAETWDPETIDRELGWAADLGFNVMRVYLHDMLWAADADGLAKRMDEYLALAAKHGIKTILVPFDSVWNPFPKPGPQDEPVPHVHNSRWVQSPHIEVQKDPARYEERLKPYLVGILTRFKEDPRILAWDLLNEPGNPTPQYQPQEGWSHAEKEQAHLIMLNHLFDWAREVNPMQPLTAGVWIHVGGRVNPVHPLDKLMLERSDIITFHTYEPLPAARRAVEWLKQSGRPIICTEYMSRGSGSTFETVMPYFKEQNVGAINWGLVNGRSQTIYPWDSWDKKYTEEPVPWFHDVFRRDGTPYAAEEATLIRKLTGKK